MENESRIARLEERLTWLQQHATEQDKVIHAQAIEIEKLSRALLALKKQMRDLPASGGGSETPEERPPHY